MVRTFGQMDSTYASDGATRSINVGSTIEAGALGGTMFNNTAGAGYVTPALLFIQFAGFTIGKSTSAFNTPWHDYPGNNYGLSGGGMTP